MGAKILIIDDEPDLVQVLKMGLEHEGYEVDFAYDGEEGLKKASWGWTDLILMDNIMPKKTGAEVAKALRKEEKTRRVPIVMISGKGEMIFSAKKKKFEWQPHNAMAQKRGPLPEIKSSEELAKFYKVDAYITKPFEPSVIAGVIKEALRKGHQQEEESDEVDIVF
jgi:DNA-binding response OmpR family regulator